MKYIKNIKVIILVLSLLLLFFLDTLNFFTNNGSFKLVAFKLSNISVTNWAAFISSIIAILGTWYFTNRSAKKTIEHEKKNTQDKINHEKQLALVRGEQEKELGYRTFNKQNALTIQREIFLFFSQMIYYNNLCAIENHIGVELFREDYRKILMEEKLFLRKLEVDFFYDTKLIELINTYFKQIEENTPLADSEEQYKMIDVSYKIYNYFYHSIQTPECMKMYKQQNENAKLRLYEKCFNNDELKFRVIISMLSDDISIEFSKLSKRQKNTIIGQLFDMPEDFNSLLDDDKMFSMDTILKYKDLIKFLNENKFIESDNEVLEIIFEIHNSVMQKKCFGINKKYYCELGNNDEQVVASFLEDYSFRVQEKAKLVNFVTNNIVNHRYI